jgi:uncharacterized protein (DUF305 family)
MNEDMMGHPMSGNPDLDFVRMMIPHHRGAVDMAEMQLKYGKNPELRKLAEDIIRSQKQEIELMRKIQKELEAQQPPAR